jgi:hypothetical protein
MGGIKMTRNEAVKLAIHYAKRFPEKYVVENFVPHEWVVQAVLAAAFQAESAATRDRYKGWKGMGG